MAGWSRGWSVPIVMREATAARARRWHGPKLFIVVITTQRARTAVCLDCPADRQRGRMLALPLLPTVHDEPRKNTIYGFQALHLAFRMQPACARPAFQLASPGSFLFGLRLLRSAPTHPCRRRPSLVQSRPLPGLGSDQKGNGVRAEGGSGAQ